MASRVLVGKMKQRDHLKHLSVDEMILLKQIHGKSWAWLIWLRT
jgi:hypothetical protein